jgi:uracil-DNA glycosylase
MSTHTPFSVLDSVDAAIGLVATRDLDSELDKEVYGIKTLSNASLDTTESKNYSNVQLNVSKTSPNITQSNTVAQKTTLNQLIKVNEGKMEMDPILLNNSKNAKTDESVIVGVGLETGLKCRPDRYLTPTIYPPNNGDRVTSIDQLVDPLKWRNLLYMFSSVPSIKEQINPIKFESVESRHSPSPSQSITSPTQISTSPSSHQPQSITSPSSHQPQSITSPSSHQPQSITSPSSHQPKSSTPPQSSTTTPQIVIEPEVRVPIITMVEYEILDTVNIVEDRDDINQGWSILDVATNAIPPGWTNVFKASIPEFEHINKSLIQDEKQHGRFYPLRKDLFKAFDMCPLSNVKVVIVGQDPYHSDDHNGYPIAMGMSFSVNRGVTIPSSLKNIYKELIRSIPNWNAPIHGNLSNWAKQGVLMLNTCLTVRPHQAKSHKSLWMGFVAKVIASLNEKNPRCIFVLWGREAEKIGNLLTNKNVVLTAPHPSGYSAYKGFIGCNHFVDINIELEKQGKRAIDWTV